MIRKKVLGISSCSATLLVQDTEANGELRVLRRINVNGWPPRDSQGAQEMYDELYKANLPGFVHIHAVLLQNAFLNVVTSFCAGGDLATYMEEEQTDPLPEKQGLLWVLVLAQSLQHLHRTAKLPCYGPVLERIYMDSDNGTAGILNGLPMCSYLYYKTLNDRRAEGVSVEMEYPPEVLQSKEYHPQLSDVWHLGHVGSKLLSAHAQLGNRSGATRQLLSRMTDPSLQKRMALDDVVNTLKSLVGDVKLNKPLERKAPTVSSAPAPAPSAAKVSAPPSLNTASSSKPTVPSAPPSSSNASSPVEVAVPPPARGAANGVNGNVRKHRDPARPAASAAPATVPHLNTNPAPRGLRYGQVQDSWHRKAEEQFAELQRMNASPTAQRHPSRNASPVGGTAGTAVHPTPATGMIPQSVPQQGRRGSSSSGVMNSSGRSSLTLDSNTKALNEMFAEREAQAARQERIREELDWRKRRQALAEQKANREHVLHQNNLRQIDGRQSDIRKHLKEWKVRQTEELAQGSGDNVVILAPRPAPPPPADVPDANDILRRLASPGGAGKKGAAARRNTSAEKRRVSDEEFLADHNKNVPVTILMPRNPPPPPEAEAKEPPPPPSEPTPAPPPPPTSPPPAKERLVGARPKTPLQRAPQPQPTATPPPEEEEALPTMYDDTPPHASRDEAPEPHPIPPPPLQPPQRVYDERIPRMRVPTPQLREHMQELLQQRRAAGAQAFPPQVPPLPTPSHLPPPPIYEGRHSITSLGNAATADMNTIATLEWTIDGVRSALRTLLGNRALYGEAMMAVAEFVARGEEARMVPRLNDEFMIHLKSLIVDNRVFGAAAPLCVQLVALEGLYQTVRESGSGPRTVR